MEKIGYRGNKKKVVSPIVCQVDSCVVISFFFVGWCNYFAPPVIPPALMKKNRMATTMTKLPIPHTAASAVPQPVVLTAVHVVMALGSKLAARYTPTTIMIMVPKDILV